MIAKLNFTCERGIVSSIGSESSTKSSSMQAGSLIDLRGFIANRRLFSFYSLGHHWACARLRIIFSAAVTGGDG